MTILKNVYKIKFTPEDESVNKFIQSIKSFGGINVLVPLIDLDSQILQSEEDKKKFYKLISYRLKIKNIKLLFRSSKDKFSLKTVVDKSNLIFLYSTIGKKIKDGEKRIFGNYIKIKLDFNKKYKYYDFTDENAFVFSLNNNKIYKILIPENAIRFDGGRRLRISIGNNDNDNGFYFICDENYIEDGGLLNEPKVYDFEKENELTEGYGELNEFEIFEVS